MFLSFFAQLFSIEKVLNRNVDIGLKMKENNYEMTSYQYQTWIEKSLVANETTFLQAVATYLKKHTIADVGLIRNGYKKMRGFTGTLAPGENFFQSFSMENFPKKVVHPWPALQEILFHGRMPVTHPFIPHVPVWGAINDMYLESDVERVLKDPPSEIRGFNRMEQEDAIFIGKKVKTGNCYDPAIQLKHGGSIFDDGSGIPHLVRGKLRKIYTHDRRIQI